MSSDRWKPRSPATQGCSQLAYCVFPEADWVPGRTNSHRAINYEEVPLAPVSPTAGQIIL